MKAKKKGSGGKLARTETIGVRLDPKLRLAAELSAAKERRTLSSFIEWAVEQAVKQIVVYQKKTGEEVASDIWNIDETARFARRAMKYPALLTHDEQRTWRVIEEVADFWEEYDPDGHIRGLHFESVRKHWDLIQQVAMGEASQAELVRLLREKDLETYKGKPVANWGKKSDGGNHGKKV